MHPLCTTLTRDELAVIEQLVNLKRRAVMAELVAAAQAGKPTVNLDEFATELYRISGKLADWLDAN